MKLRIFGTTAKSSPKNWNVHNKNIWNAFLNFRTLNKKKIKIKKKCKWLTKYLTKPKVETTELFFWPTLSKTFRKRLQEDQKQPLRQMMEIADTVGISTERTSYILTEVFGSVWTCLNAIQYIFCVDLLQWMSRRITTIHKKRSSNRNNGLLKENLLWKRPKQFCRPEKF